MTDHAFDDLTDIYDSMIDWPKRLANEGPFFQRLFEQAGVRKVVDVACGTGRHAAMFHSWGLDVQGADISPTMIERARALFGESDRLHWTVRGFDQPISAPGCCDAVICVGNSLALAPDMSVTDNAVRQMLHALRPGGLAIVHVLNIWKMPDGPCVWQKTVRKNLSSGEAIILKGVHRSSNTAFVDLVVIDHLTSAAPASRSRSVSFLGIKADDLLTIAMKNGAAKVTFFGGQNNETYDPATSTDLIMVAEKKV